MILTAKDISTTIDQSISIVYILYRIESLEVKPIPD